MFFCLRRGRQLVLRRGREHSSVHTANIVQAQTTCKCGPRRIRPHPRLQLKLTTRHPEPMLMPDVQCLHLTLGWVAFRLRFNKSIEYKGPVEQANNYKNAVIIIRTFILFTVISNPATVFFFFLYVERTLGLTVQSVPLRALVEQSIFRELFTSISSTQAWQKKKKKDLLGGTEHQEAAPPLHSSGVPNLLESR